MQRSDASVSTSQTSKGSKYHNPYLYGYLATLLIGSYQYGINMSIFGSCLDLYAYMYGWTSGQKTLWSSVCTALLPVGAIIGSILSGKLMAFGRRPALFLAAALDIVGVLYISVTQLPDAGRMWVGLFSFCFGRIIIGISVGLYTSFTSYYINEISPEDKRSIFGSSHQLLLSAGIITSYGIGLVLPDPDKNSYPHQDYSQHYSWRLSMAIPALLVSIQVASLHYIYKYDSPQFYVAKGDMKTAEAALKCIYVDDADVKKKLNEYSVAAAARKAAEAAKNGVSLYTSYKRGFWVGMIMPMILQLTGINAVTFYARIMFSKQHNSKLLSLCMTLVNLISAAGAIPVVAAFGRRKLMLVGSVAAAAGHFVCFISGYVGENENGYNWTYNVGAYFMIAAITFTHGSMCWLYMAEVLPPQWMGYGIASSWTFTCLIGIASPWCFEYMQQWTYMMFAAFMVAAFVFCYKYCIETRGKSKQTIIKEFTDCEPTPTELVLEKNQPVSPATRADSPVGIREKRDQKEGGCTSIPRVDTVAGDGLLSNRDLSPTDKPAESHIIFNRIDSCDNKKLSVSANKD